MRPTRRAIGLTLGVLALGLGCAVLPALVPAWQVALLTTVLIVAADARFAARTPVPRVTRQLPAALAVGQRHTVTVRVDNEAGRRIHVWLHEGVPAGVDATGLPVTLDLPVRGWVELTWDARPTRRGASTLAPTELWIDGPIGLLSVRRHVGESVLLRVYPDFREVAKFALLALQQRTAQMGIHLRRRRGEGTEFFQLREYRPGDTLRQIDWKAVARRRQLISREYREEQDQQVVVLMDCGRRLRAVDGRLSHFDHMLNAALLLGYVALRHGDAVGLLTFSGPDRWMAPTKGRGAIRTLLNTVFDLEPTAVASDYADAALRLMARQRRRALVIVLTNLRDDDGDDLIRALAPLRRRHLVLVASLREGVVGRLTDTEVRTLADAITTAAAFQHLELREKAHAAVRAAGFLTLDVEPEALPVALTNRYLEIKQAGRL